MAQAAQGTELQLGDGSSPEQFTRVAAVHSLTGPSLSGETFDRTELDDTWRKRRPTILDGGEVTAEIHFDPDLATHDDLETALTGKSLDTWRVCFPDFSTDLTFTADAGTDTLTTASDHDYNTGQPVQVSTTGTLPAGLSTGTTYYARRTGTDTLTLHPTSADAVADTNTVDITDTGTGTHTISRGEEWAFDAYVTGFEPAASVGDGLGASVTLSIDGQVSIS
ncbi:MAG: hypothetical protein R6X20_15735 [Phycisphaerae bacterium]